MTNRILTTLALAFTTAISQAQVHPDTSSTKLYTLDAIVVTANRESSSLYHSPASISVITMQDISMRNVYTIAEMVSILPSITLEGTTKGAFRCPSIRGFSASNNLVLIDGIPVNTGFANWGNIVSLPSNEVKKIEVVRGSNSIVYGANAMGGVVNIITPRGEQKMTAHAGVRLGSFGFQKYLASLGGEIQNMHYLFALSKDKANGYRRNTDFNGWNLSTKLNLAGLTFSGGYVDARMGVPLAPQTFERYDYWRTGRATLAFQTQPMPSLLVSTNAFVNLEQSKLQTFVGRNFSGYG